MRALLTILFRIIRPAVFHKSRGGGRALAALALMGALAVAAGPTAAQSEESEESAELEGLEESEGGAAETDEEYEGRELAEERWLDADYGISLRLPTGVRTVSRTADDYQLRVADEDERFTMGVVVKQSRRELNLADVVAKAKVQVLGVHRTTELLEEYALRVDEDVPMGVLLFRTPDTPEEDAFRGQALVQLDANTIAIVEASSAWSDVELARSTFEAMVRTLELEGLKELEQQRKREIERTRKWRREVGVSELHEALIEEQLFRIVADGDDIGYMRIRQNTAEQEGKEGIQVEVQSRVVTGQFNVDSKAVYFSSNDDLAEYWTVTTTQRPRSGSGGSEQEQTFVETGIRTGADIVVTRDKPLGSDSQELKQPATGYIPLAETWLLPQILPNDRPATYGFYAYNTNENRLTYRTEQVEPALDGYVVTTQLRPNAQELEASFDADRAMREKQLGPGRKLVPTTAQRLSQIWRTR